MLFDTDVLIWMFRGMKKAAQLVNTTPERQLSIINYMEILPLIAATACEHHLTLCTANQKHMKSIAGLDFLLFTP